jgi:hypothetical protein
MAAVPGGTNPVSPAKVDFTYQITDLSEVSYIDIGNKIRAFASQTGAYWAILYNILKGVKPAADGKPERVVNRSPEAIQANMAAKYKPDLNFYVMSPEFSYRQPAYLLSYPERQKMRVHSMQLQDTLDNIVEEALRLQQYIIQNSDLAIDVVEGSESAFKGEVLASTYGIGPKTDDKKIVINTGNPSEFISSLITLFNLTNQTKVTVKAGSPLVIPKFLSQYMTTL